MRYEEVVRKLYEPQWPAPGLREWVYEILRHPDPDPDPSPTLTSYPNPGPNPSPSHLGLAEATGQGATAASAAAKGEQQAGGHKVLRPYCVSSGGSGGLNSRMYVQHAEGGELRLALVLASQDGV